MVGRADKDQRVRSELTVGDKSFGSEDPDAAQGFFDLEYRGARFSFGYGACPNLEDRANTGGPLLCVLPGC